MNHQNIAGWCHPDKLAFTENWFKTHPQTLIVEIGVYAGDYLIPMALWNPDCKVVGIDPWELEPALEGMVDEGNREWWIGANRFQEIESLVRRTAPANVTLLKMTSDEAVEYFTPSTITTLSVDGNHGPQAIRDAKTYLPLVAPGGLIAMDDTWWMEAGVANVQIATDWLVANGCKQLEDIHGCAFLEKVA